MSYLTSQDYKKQIQSDNLLQIIGSDTSILSSAELAAEAEAKSYLVQKYIVSQEFTDTSVWSRYITYNAKDRVYLDGNIYNQATTYFIGDLVNNNGGIYIAISDTSPGSFDENLWTLLGQRNDMFYGKLPYPEFNYLVDYPRDYQIYWNGKVYTNKVATSIISHDTLLQAGYISNINSRNIFPDNIAYGLGYWGTGIPYFIPTGTLPTDSSKWVPGDNRNQQLVQYLIDIVLYHIHSRISPRNIPEIRVKRYDDAIAWLDGVAKGKFTADISVIQTRSGGRIRFGGRVKLINDY